jgi:hypothetical protein
VIKCQKKILISIILILLSGQNVPAADVITKDTKLNVRQCIEIIKKGIGEIWHESNIKV